MQLTLLGGSTVFSWTRSRHYSTFGFSAKRASRQTTFCNAGTAALDGVAPAPSIPDEDRPIVKIDNRSDPFSTVIEIKYGKKLGELLDTVQSLRSLGLTIRRAKVRDSAVKGSKFYITDAETSEKIMKSAKLEEIRLTVLNNMLHYHPESAEQLGWGGADEKAAAAKNPLSPLGPKARTGVRTTITVQPVSDGRFTQLDICTGDRPGLLTDIVSNLKNMSINVVSAEVDTIGDEAQDTFFVTYHGEALSASMETLIVNVLQYHLQLAEFDAEESY